MKVKTPLTFEQYEKAIIKLAELAELEYARLIPECGGDFDEIACAGCDDFLYCRKLDQQRAIYHELVEILESDQ